MGYDTKEAFAFLSWEYYGMSINLKGLVSMALSQLVTFHAELN